MAGEQAERCGQRIRAAREAKNWSQSRLARETERDVNVTRPVSQDDISAHQNAEGGCSASASIVGTFGSVQ